MKVAPDTITVMTVNLRFGLASDGENAWENRKNAYPALFIAHSPHFIGVQEANDFQISHLAAMLDNHRHIGEHEPHIGPVRESWQDNIIFYRKEWTCLKNKHYFLSDTPEVESQFPESRWPRQCTIGHFKKSGRSLIHVNTHFDFASDVQEKSAGVVLSLLREFPSGVPTLITGDFNTSPESRTYNLFMEEGFKDMFKDHHTSTFHGFTGRDLGGHIDWILYRGDLVAMDHRVIQEPFNGVYPSDHYPVIAVFKFI